MKAISVNVLKMNPMIASMIATATPTQEVNLKRFSVYIYF